MAISPKDGYELKLKEIGCKHIELDIKRTSRNIYKELLVILKYAKIYRKIKPDVILNFTPKANIYSSIAAFGSKINVINNISGLGKVFLSNGLLTKLVLQAYKLSSKSANTVFFQNREDLNHFIDQGIVCPNKAKYIPGSGVCLSKFSINPSPDDDKIRFILVARILKEKGIFEYINAADILNKENHNLEFAILGPIDTDNPDSIQEEKLLEITRKSNIQYLGKSDDVASIVKKYDCVVLPSYYKEGVPKSLLEAAAMGKPLITTDNVGCRDIVLDGVNGFLCEKKNPASLAKAMYKIIKIDHQERLKIGLNGRKLIEEKFDEKVVIDKYMREINSFL